MKRIVHLSLVFTLGLIPMFSQIVNVPADSSTIQAAINGTSDGDTVLVAEGTYLENINFLGRAITVASLYILDGDTSHISKTIINGSKATNPDTASVVLMMSGEDTTSVLMGFTITGGKGTKAFPMRCGMADDFICGAGIFISGSGGKITDNIIEENHSVEKPGEWGILGCGLYANVSANQKAIIRNNIIRGNTGRNGGGWGGGVVLIGGDFLMEDNVVSDNNLSLNGLAIGGGLMYWIGCDSEISYKVIIRNNFIAGNQAWTTNNYGFGGGVGLYNGKDLEFYNNIVVDNYANGFGGGLYLGMTNKHRIYNNTVINNRAAKGGNSISFDFDNDVVIFNNIIWGNADNGKSEYYKEGSNNKGLFIHNNLREEPSQTAYSFTLTQNILLEPLFKKDSYMPADHSPPCGRGIDSLEIDGKWYYAPGRDYNDSIRPHPIDDFVDMGAYESPYERYVFIPDVVAVDNLYQPDSIKATSSEDGFIYLVPKDTDKDIIVIRQKCIDSVEVKANIEVNISLSDLGNGVYWLYARNSIGNLSEPEEFVINGVGFENRKAEEIGIYPNPISNLLTIETDQSDHYSLKINSLNGQQLHIGEMEGTSHQLDLSSFQKGVYFITIRSENFITTRKIIKL